MTHPGTRAVSTKIRALYSPTFWLFWLTLAITIALWVPWSHYRLFWADELLEYYTDVKPTAAQVIAGQLHAPFSLEPPGFHLLLHLTHRLVPRAKLAARLPSLGALLLTEMFAYLLTARVSRSKATGLVAMVLPLYLVTADYGVEARAYGALTACMACALWCWAYAVTGGTRRKLALAGMTAALVAAVWMHFYGVFLLLPLCVGEVSRTWERRRIDVKVVSGLFVAVLAVLVDVPFARALSPFRQHYYNTGETHWANTLFTYYWLYRHFRGYTDPVGEVTQGAIVCTCAAAVLVFASLLRARRHWRSGDEVAPVELALCATAALPVVNLVAAQFTKAYFPRYSLPAVVGLVILVALSAKTFLVLPRIQIAFACFLGCGAVQYAATLTEEAKAARDAERSHLRLTPEQERELARLPDKQVYFQNVARYLFFHYYVGSDLQPVLTGFYSESCELRWAGRNPASLFARNMAATTDVRFDTFRSLRERPGPHLLVLYHDPNEEWIESELRAAKARVSPLGRAFGGDLVEVDLPRGSTCDADPQGGRL